MNKNWKENKIKHFNLSEQYASEYDENYAQSNYATGSYMEYELSTIQRFAKEAPSNYLALDLGCGTGRDSFLLTKFFEQVIGYDFSPNMIKTANYNKLSKQIGNVSFYVSDIEDGLAEIQDGSVPFVNTAFGMGSFVSDIQKLCAEIKRVLMPQGVSIFSFYNSDALVNNLNLEWRPAISAILDPENDCLNVDINGNIHTIAAKSYNVKEIRKKLEGFFSILEITTFPTLSALFPTKLFENDTARNLCKNVDQILSNNLDIAAGPYIIVICRKTGSLKKERELKGYEKFLYMLRNHKIKSFIKEHEPAKNMQDIFKILGGVPHDTMITSMLISIQIDKMGDKYKHYLIGLPADRKLDFGKLATFLRVNRKNIKQTDMGLVEELTGFIPGSIPPFAMPKKIPVIIDHRLLSKDFLWCGTGKVTESIKIATKDLRKMSNCVDADISKPRDII